MRSTNKECFFIVEQLAVLGKPFDYGKLKAFVTAERPMEEVDHASWLDCWLSQANHPDEIVPPAAILDTNDSNRHTDIREAR